MSYSAVDDNENWTSHELPEEMESYKQDVFGRANRRDINGKMANYAAMTAVKLAAKDKDLKLPLEEITGILEGNTEPIKDTALEVTYDHIEEALCRFEDDRDNTDNLVSVQDVNSELEL